MLLPDFSKTIPDLLKALNPFHFLVNAVQENHDNFRIEVEMRYLNELIHLEVEKSEKLLELDVVAREGKIILRGEYHIGDNRFANLFKIYEVLFHVELIPVWVKNNQVRFRVMEYKLRNKKKKTIDLVRILSAIFPYHKTLLLKKLVQLYPSILSLTRLQNEVRLNLNFYFQKAGILSSSARVHQFVLNPNKVVLSLRSNSVLKPLVDFFGSNIISITEIKNEGSLVRREK